MRLFSHLYERVLHWSRHPRAPYFLGAVSFAESSFFPIPPDPMLISMTLACPQRAWYFATVTTVCSVIGGIFGYLIGAFFLQLIYPYIEMFGYMSSYQQVHQWFLLWGFWVVLIAGFTPIPYKIFTISAGAMSMAFIPFLLASAVGRGLRFFLVSGIMFWGGEHLHRLFQRYIEKIGWMLVLILIAIIFFWYQ